MTRADNETTSSGGLTDLTTGELDQLENIGSSTISATQWGYLGATDQAIATTDAVAFNSAIIDSTNTEALLVRKDADGGDVFTVDTTNEYVLIQETTGRNAATVDVKDLLYLRSEGTTGTKWPSSFEIHVGSYEANIAARSRVDFKLSNGYSIAADTTVMTMNANGRVGIGNTAPTTELDVTGAIKSSGTITSAGSLVLTSVAVSDLDNGTDGELITWDASGVATTVAVGTATHVLTSNGAGAAPTFQASGSGLTTGSFVYVNNTSVAADITGLIFDKTVNRGAEIFLTTFTDSTSGDKATVSTVNIVTDGAAWGIVEDTKVSTTATNIIYSITSAGQLQYTSPNDGGFTSGVMKWIVGATPV